jgi:hypothetical protein
MHITDNLRSRFRPEWKQADPALHTMFENALTFIAAPQAKRAAIEKAGTLNARGVAEEMRREMGKLVVPELRRILREVNGRRDAVQAERAALATPKTDATDAPLRAEARAYLRSLTDGERMQTLLADPDPLLLAAALEAPSALSGLTAETRAHVEKACVEANHLPQMNAMDDRQEALNQVCAAVEIAMIEIRKHVGLEGPAFDEWFGTADGSGLQRAA